MTYIQPDWLGVWLAAAKWAAVLKAERAYTAKEIQDTGDGLMNAVQQIADAAELRVWQIVLDEVESEPEHLLARAKTNVKNLEERLNGSAQS